MISRELQRMAELANDEFVELLFCMGLFPQDLALQKAFFERVYSIMLRLVQRSTDVERKQLLAVFRDQCRILTAAERRRMWDRIKKVVSS